MENDAWNLSKHETYIFKFYDQVNKDYIIFNFSDYTVILLLTFLSILVLSWHPYGSIPFLLIRAAAAGKMEYKNFEDP